MQGADIRTRGEKARVGPRERTAAEPSLLPYVKQMTGASSMHEAGTQSRCSGTARREGWGRRCGVQDGGHTHPWQIHVNSGKTTTMVLSNHPPIK